MLPAISRGSGKNMGFPDVCNTPAGPVTVPVPYPNIGAHDQALAFSPNVFLSGKNALHTGSVIAMTSGDEGGTAHPMIKQAGKFTSGNPVVHVNMLPGIHVGCPTTGNNMNNMLGAAVLSAVKNVFYTFAGAAPRTPDGPASTTKPAGRDPRDERDQLADLADELAAAARRDGPPLTWSLSEEGIGVVRIEIFSADVPSRLAAAMDAFEAAGAGAAVIDLRGNPGGDLAAFVSAASSFLPEGTRIAALADTEGDRLEYRAFHEQACSLPLVILVDGWTASAAELFAACLESHGRAVIVGGPTFGKRTAHCLVTSPEGGLSRALCGSVEVGNGSPARDTTDGR